MALGGGSRMKGMPAPPRHRFPDDQDPGTEYGRDDEPKGGPFPVCHRAKSRQHRDAAPAKQPGSREQQEIRCPCLTFEASDATDQQPGDEMRADEKHDCFDDGRHSGHRDQGREKQQRRRSASLSPHRDRSTSRQAAPADPRFGAAIAPSATAIRHNTIASTACQEGFSQFMPASRPWRGRRCARQCRPP